MFIYLAHPIDLNRGTGPDAACLRRMINSTQTGLIQQGHSIFRPGEAYFVGGSSTPDPAAMGVIDDINRHALWSSDGIVALLPPGIPTLGTVSEIEQALMLNRPTLIVTTVGVVERSVQIGSWIRRGAKVRVVKDDGYWKDETPDFTETLRSLPDPTKLVLSEEQVTGPPVLLVSGEAANLQPGKYEGDAGLDLAISHDWRIEPGEYQMLSTGVHLAVPQGYYALITGRSSTWAKYRCTVVQAVIDAGYRGELMIGLRNEGAADVKFEKGMRLAQVIVLPVFGGKLEPVEALPPSHRGEAGYGSSGK